MRRSYGDTRTQERPAPQTHPGRQRPASEGRALQRREHSETGVSRVAHVKKRPLQKAAATTPWIWREPSAQQREGQAQEKGEPKRKAAGLAESPCATNGKPKSGPPRKDGPYRGKRSPRTDLKVGHYKSNDEPRSAFENLQSCRDGAQRAAPLQRQENPGTDLKIGHYKGFAVFSPLVGRHTCLTKDLPWASEPRQSRTARATIVTTSKLARAH